MYIHTERKQCIDKHATGGKQNGRAKNERFLIGYIEDVRMECWGLSVCKERAQERLTLLALPGGAVTSIGLPLLSPTKTSVKWHGDLAKRYSALSPTAADTITTEAIVVRYYTALK